MKLESFEQRFNKGPGCWLWTGARTNKGYGVINIWNKGKRVSCSAHRHSFEIYKGPTIKGLVVMHSCDTPLCVNPDHLTLGTYKQNRDDMVKKGRKANQIGESAPRAKLTTKQVILIRKIYKPFDKRFSCRALARKFSVHHATIWLIVSGKNWSHI